MCAGALICITAVLTFGGYSSIKSIAQNIIQEKLNDWLSLENKNSLLKESLEEVRMRTVLDSLIVRLERNKLTTQYSSTFEMTPLEEKRLVTYMQEPNTSELDFRDATRILSAHIGLYPRVYPEPEIDQMVKSIFSERFASNEKRYLLLVAFSNYSGLYEYANQILQKDDMPSHWKMAAFKIVRTFNDKTAVKYAKKYLLHEDNASFQMIMAEELANEIESAPLDDWLKKQSVVGNEAITYIQLADKISTHHAAIPVNEETQRKVFLKRKADFFFQGIAHGAIIKLCSYGSIIGDLCVQKGNTSYVIRNPSSIFEDDSLLSEIASTASLFRFPPDQLIKSLIPVNSSSDVVFGIRVDLVDESINCKVLTKIDKNSTSGTLLLTQNTHNDKLQASFRSLDGRWLTEKVILDTNLYKMKLHFAFDRGFMQQTEMKLYREEAL